MPHFFYSPSARPSAIGLKPHARSPSRDSGKMIATLRVHRSMPPQSPIPSEITRLLHRWKEGDRNALATLASLAYDDLHAIASGYLRREGSGHTLQATGLVN